MVSLGKLGRVELKSETTVKLTFTDSNFTLTTGDGQITAGAKKTEVTVDTSCGNTLVAVKKGSVELRAGDSVKQIAAGNQDAPARRDPAALLPDSARCVLKIEEWGTRHDSNVRPLLV